jgi:streptogramin lyase
VQKFNADGGFMTEWSVSGPADVAVDNAGNVFTIRGNDCLIEKFNSTGTIMTSWQFQIPWTCGGNGIAVNDSGHVYITDYRTDAVRKFDSVGNQLLSWSVGDPVGIATDSTGDVYVVTTYEGAKKFGPNGSSIATFGQFNNPYHVVVDGLGGVFVVDSGTTMVTKFTSGGF